jgi:hypothetical protein
MIDLNYLEKLIDETNEELLKGAETPFHLMTREAQEAFVLKMEKLYKNCITIRLQKSLKKYKVGLDFEGYKNQEHERRTKQASAVSKANSTKERKLKRAKEQVTKDFANLQSDTLAAVLEMAGACPKCMRKKDECACEKVA